MNREHTWRILSGPLAPFILFLSRWSASNNASAQTEACRYIFVSGGVNIPQEYELDTSSGSFDFAYNIREFDQARFIVDYEGNTVFDSGCFDGGRRSALVNYSGNSRIITVAYQDCDGNPDDYDYTITCSDDAYVNSVPALQNAAKVILVFLLLGLGLASIRARNA